MDAARWHEIKTAFDSLLELEPSLRSIEVGKIGVRDPELRRALEGLLSAHFKESDEFLEIPAAALAPLGDDPEEDSRLGTHVGPYELVRELGSGGMGEVYLARRVDAEFEQQVAIKLIRSGQDSAAVVRRFRAERQILANLDHPNIAKLLDGGRTAQGQPYFVMEYVAGLPITDYCDQHRLRIRERIELFLQACEGVQHAHQNAIIHRDLKPANILVIEVDGRAVPRIIDFGIAKAASVNLTEQTLLTRMGQFVGTPGYMSPEQADPNAKNTDSRTDVYSLGVILYVLLTGLQPFETASGKMPPLDVWLRQLREEEPPRPSRKITADTDTTTATMRNTVPTQLVRELRGDLDWIVMKALERERERRYGTPSELAAELRRYLNEEPVTARPASARYQMRKFVRRHRFATAFIGMVTVLSVVASAAAMIALKQKREAELQRSEAEHQTAEAVKAQARLLTQAAGQRLKDKDVAGAQGIILAVLTSPEFAQSHASEAISVFQETRAADAELAVLSGHGGLVYSARYSPDGSRIVTASFDKTVRVWDARTGVQLQLLHAGFAMSTSYSPDGNRILTASTDKTARIWDVSTGDQITVLSGHGDRVNSAAYSGDGTRIVTASSDKTARIWDAHTGAQLGVLSGHDDIVASAAYSPDGTRIVTASADKTARIWDSRTGAQLAVLSGHAEFVRSAAYSPDGTRIVTASADNTARIWDAHTGAQIAVFSSHAGFVRSAAYSPDGTRIVTSSDDKTARIWDAQTGTQLTVLSGHRDIVGTAAYSPDGTRIVTASYDKTARIWDARTGAELTVLPGHGDPVTFADYRADGTRVVTASLDKTVRIWDARTGAPLSVLSGHRASVDFAAYSPDGTHVVSASEDTTARIWDATTGAQLVVISGHAPGFVDSAVYSPDGTRIVTSSSDKTARIWDASTGAQLAVLSGHASFVYSAAYSPDGTRIVTASNDKTARIWDASTGTQLMVLAGHDSGVAGAAYSPDGTRIVTASNDKTARIWDTRSGAELTVLSGHEGGVARAVYSPDGTRIVTASVDKTARIWDAHTGAQLAVLSGHGDIVVSAAYSPNGTRIVTASFDKTARIWDARIPATLEAQILWAKAAQSDPLTEVDRTELGLMPDARVRRWANAGSACDKAAAAFYDPDRLTSGHAQSAIVADVAKSACLPQASSGNTPRETFQAARALLAKSDVKGAKQQLERAVSEGYRTAQVDLANLLVDASAGMLDPKRAIALDQKAWHDGVPIAAYSLGHFYEAGVTGLQPDLGKAWEWYKKGADAGEPNALARFAEQSEKQALAETDSDKSAALLLDAFSEYAAAAERATAEDWPDDAWRHWRYRRATLARLLARQGMMQQVADTYAAVLARTQR